jgi:hypothetical protein
MITGLQESMPKSISLLPFDGGVTGTYVFPFTFFNLYFEISV